MKLIENSRGHGTLQSGNKKFMAYFDMESSHDHEHSGSLVDVLCVREIRQVFKKKLRVRTIIFDVSCEILIENCRASV